MNKIIKKLLKNICVYTSKMACGTASFNYTFQPKEPNNIKELLNKK